MTCVVIIPTNPAGLIVAALQPDAIGTTIDKAIDAGSPLVTVDTDAPASKRQTYLGTENYQAGRAMAGAMLDARAVRTSVGRDGKCPWSTTLSNC